MIIISAQPGWEAYWIHDDESTVFIGNIIGWRIFGKADQPTPIFDLEGGDYSSGGSWRDVLIKRPSCEHKWLSLYCGDFDTKEELLAERRESIAWAKERAAEREAKTA